jgi:hypothetical protein
MNTDTFSIDPPPGPTGPSELVVIDAGVADPDTLIAALPPGTAVLLLDPGRDGLEQIAAALQGRTGLTALHIVSHGAPGQIVLGSTLLGATTLAAHADALAALGAALAEHGDLLLYGCDVAVGEAGLAFIGQLAALTGADVAASDDPTGFGGDWLLERQSGAVEAAALRMEDYAHALAFGQLIVGDGSGGGGGGNTTYGAGGAGGGGADTLTGTAGDDVIFGDGSGGGGGGNTRPGGVGGGGNDILHGGAGNDILFGDGFHGATGAGPSLHEGGDGGFGGGGGGGGGASTAAKGGQGGLGGGWRR